jgi:hypothetical protein
MDPEKTCPPDIANQKHRCHRLGKRNRLHSAEAKCRRENTGSLLLFLAGRGGGLGSLGLGGALLEFVHATGGIHEFLLAGVKRMADVANADDDYRLGGAGRDHVAAGATDFRVHIFWMNVRLHKKGSKFIMDTRDDKGEFQGMRKGQPESASAGEGFSADKPAFLGKNGDK